MCNCNEQFRMITPEEARTLKHKAFVDSVLENADHVIRAAALNGKTKIGVRIFCSGDEDEFSGLVTCVQTELQNLGFEINRQDYNPRGWTDLLINWHM
jgi:hypothetical protein